MKREIRHEVYFGDKLLAQTQGVCHAEDKAYQLNLEMFGFAPTCLVTNNQSTSYVSLRLKDGKHVRIPVVFKEDSRTSKMGFLTIKHLKHPMYQEIDPSE